MIRHLDFVLAIAPILISAAVTWIAYSQYVTNRNKLRLDMYNRRFAVFEATLAYYQAYFGDEADTAILQKRATEFIRAYRESVFLFGEKSSVYAELTKIKDVLAFLVAFDEKFTSEPYDKDEYSTWSKARESKPDITAQMNELEKALKPWLDFHKIEK